MNHQLKTEQFAELAGVKPRTILLAHSRAKNYLGIKPIKLPNGRLRWNEADVLAALGVADGH